LTGDCCDVVEVRVVVHDRERGRLGDCRDEELRHLASLESADSELALDLLRPVEVMCFYIDSTERSECND
jgi:hypothetical protein